MTLRLPASQDDALTHIAYTSMMLEDRSPEYIDHSEIGRAHV